MGTRCVVAAAWLVAGQVLAQQGLTPLEHGWLDAARPVLAAARGWTLPLDVVVQPQPNAGEAPLAIGLLGGRCKLLMTLRADGSRAAPGVDPTLDAQRIEAMFAHEVAHCWRHAQGAWFALPAGFAERPPNLAPAGVVALRRDMEGTRREEAFADLVALAWIAEHHPAHYRRVHDWMRALRDDQPIDGAHHDTRAWLVLARDASVFARSGSVFERAHAVWVDGLQRIAD
jgi:hypothetical protein